MTSSGVNGTGTPSLYPACWADDEVMQGHMSMIKARSINPIDHDRKVKFWVDAIAGLCRADRNALITLDGLKKKFRRGDQIPAGLSTVVEHMKRKGDVVSLNEWQEKRGSWVDWGVSKTSSWLFGNPSLDNVTFIHMATIQSQAADVLQLYLDEFKSEVDCTGEVVAYSDFFDKANHIFRTMKNFDIVLDYLSDAGDVTIGTSRNGDKILKFKDVTNGRGSPVRFTEADSSVHDIRKAMSKIEKDISVLEEKVKKLDVECRKALRSGEKTRAASFLRQKKRVEKDISDKDGQLQGLLTMLHQLSSTKLNREVLDAYQLGARAFKANLARHGLSPDKVDETMDSIASTFDDYKEMEEAMGQGFGLRSKDNDEALENELEELLAEQNKPAVPAGHVRLPDVPSGTFGISDEAMDDGSLEKRLQRLREGAN